MYGIDFIMNHGEMIVHRIITPQGRKPLWWGYVTPVGVKSMLNV